MKNRCLRAARIAGALTVTLISLWHGRAQAYSVSKPWSGNSFSYYVNEDSFNTDLNGLTVSDAQARYWVAWSLKQWAAHSAANISFSFDGDTNLGDNPFDNPDTWNYCNSNEGSNFVAVLDGCVDEDCVFMGYAYRWSNSTNMTRAQVCIAGSEEDYELDTDNLDGSETDLASLLSHELGHALGMEHDNSSPGIMKSSGTAGNTRNRVPCGDDIQGIRDLYGTASRDLRAGEFQGSSFNYVTAATGAPYMRYGATIGEDASNDLFVVRSGPQTSGAAINFTRSAYPLTGSSSWTNRTMSVSTWVAPTLVANNSYIVAAWPGVTPEQDSCSGITVARTADVFDSASTTSLPNDCTKHEVSMAHDPTTGTWIMAYSRYSYSNQAVNERIMMRVSDDGITWSGSAQDIGIRTPMAPAISCSDEECILVYTHRSDDPGTYTRSFTVDDVNNDVDVSGSWTSISPRTIAPPGAGGRTTSPDVLVVRGGENNSEIEFAPSAAAPANWATEYLVSSNALYGGVVAAFNRTNGGSNPKPYVFYVIP